MLRYITKYSHSRTQKNCSELLIHLQYDLCPLKIDVMFAAVIMQCTVHLLVAIFVLHF